jgi:hypothetical protein
VLAELTVALGVFLLVAAVVLLHSVWRLRCRVRRASWLLTRAGAAVSEAQRASVVAGGLQLVDHLFGGVARNGEADPDAAR